MNFQTAIGQGFRSANQSWQGIGIYIFGWAIFALLAGGLFFVTQPPVQALQKAFRESQEIQQQRTLSAVQASQESIQSDSSAQPQDAANPDAAVPQAKTPDPFEDDPEIAKWFSRAWPILAVMFLALFIFLGYAYSWQMGYAVSQVEQKTFYFQDSLRDATRLFMEYLKAFFLGSGVTLLVLLVVAGFVALFFWLLPDAAAGALTFVLIFILAIGAIWVGMTFSFWYPAIACDGQGILAAARASFEAMRPRFFQVLGFYCLLGLIQLGVNIVLRIVGFIVGLILGQFQAAALALSGVWIMGILGFAAGIYLSFFLLYAPLHYYLGVRDE